MKTRKTLFLRPMHIKHVQAPTDMRKNSYPQNTMNRHLNNLLGTRHGTSGLWALLLVVCTALGFAVQSNAQSFELKSRSNVTQESCLPANSAFDPGETNTVTFTFKNTTATGDALSPMKEIHVTLLGGTGNVAFPVKDANTPDNDKVTLVSGGARFDVPGSVAKDGTFTVTFRFRADGTCGDTLTPTFTINAKGANGAAYTTSQVSIAGASVSKFLLGEIQTTTYGPYTSGAITINDFDPDSAKLGRASAYPSKITIADGTIPNAKTKTGERLAKVKITLNTISHDYTRDIRALLVSPNGQKIMLMRSAGGQASGTTSIPSSAPINLTFDSVASNLGGLPQNAQVVGGSFRPTDFGVGSNLPSDAPAEPYSTDLTTLHASRYAVDLTQSTVDAAVDALNPKGDWKLYVQDGTPGGTGSIAGGWSITFETQKVVCCGAGLTFPTITQNNIPVIGDVTLDEDNTLVTTDTSSQGGSKQNGGAAHLGNNTADGLPVTFNIRDIETTDMGTLVGGLQIVSGNESIIKSSNIRIGKRNGGEIKFDYQPEPNQNGNVPVTLTLTDSSGQATSTSFTLKVTSRNDFPVFNTFPFNQSVNSGASTDTLGFTISDVETDSNSLIVSAISQNTAIVPNTLSNIQLSGVGSNRQIRVVPVDSSSASATIQVTITDGNGDTATKDLTIAFTAVAGNPTITPIGAVTMNQDTSKTVEFEIRPGTGSTTATDSLALAVSVTDTAGGLLVPANIQLSGSGTRRIATITPALNLTGTATAKITVTDNSFSPARSGDTGSFTVRVDPVNQAPTITSIASQTIDANKATGDISFTITDRETPLSGAGAFANFNLGDALPASARVFATIVSQDPADLLPAGSVVFTGTGGTRTVKVTPKADRFGKALIKITAADAGQSGNPLAADEKSASSQFLLTVNFVNKSPSIGGITGTGQNDNTDTDIANISINTIASDATDFSGATFTVNENQAIVGNATGRFVDGNSDKDVVEKTLTLTGISPGADSESDQTVTISAVAADTSLIKSLGFATDANKVKLNNTTTTLKYTLGKNLSGSSVVTLTLDDGNGGVTTRKFKITVRKINNSPTITLAGAPAATTRISNRSPISVSAIVTDRETTQQNMTIAFSVSDTADAQLTAGNTPLFGGDVGTAGAGGFVPASTSVDKDPSFRAITVTPANSAWGATDRPVKVAVTYTDAAVDAARPLGIAKSVSASFTVLFADIAPNTAPRIVKINSIDTQAEPPAAEFTPVDSVSLPSVPQDTVATTSVRVYDDDLAGTGVRLVPVSTSDANIVSLSNVLIGGAETAATRQVAIIPNSSVTGTVTIGLEARDSSGLVSSRKSVVVNFFRPEGPPVITLQTDADGTDGAKWSGNRTILTVKEDVTPVPDPKRGSGFVEVKINGSSVTSLDQLTLSGAASGTGAGIVSGFDYATGALDSTGNQTRIVKIKLNSNLNSGGADSAAATTCTITLTVTDTRSRTATATFTLNVTPSNDAPTINDVANQSISEDPNNSATAAALTVVNLANLTTGGDTTEQAGQTMSVSVSVKDLGSDSNTLIDTSAAGGFVVTPTGGTGVAGNLSATGISSAGGVQTATISFRPNKNKSGTSVFTVTVQDNGGTGNGGADKTTKTFNVVVNQFNVAPTFLSGIPDQVVTQATAGQVLTNTVSFGIKDGDVGAPGETPVEQLVVTATSSNQTVIPNANITVSGAGSSRSVSATPVTDQLGDSTITVRVTDKGKSDGSDVKFTEITYKVTVRPKTSPDIIGLITVDNDVTNRVTMDVNSEKLVSFRVRDTQTDASLISVAITADNTALLGSPIVVSDASDTGLRRVVLRPGKDLAGTTVVTVTVTDRDTPTANSSSGTFILQVSGFKPSISGILPDYTVATNGTLTINFNVASTSPSSSSLLLTATATSSNPAFIPGGSIVPGGSGSSRSLTIVPNLNTGGSSTITLTVTDPVPNSFQTNIFVVHTAITPNTAPTISTIANQTVDKNGSTSQIPFTVGDAETPATALTVTAQSSNTDLVPVFNILLPDKSVGANRTVLVQPALGKEGVATITLTVTDTGTSGGASLIASTAFTVTVSANNVPTISDIAAVSIQRNTSTAPISFIIGDVETLATALTVSATSDNSALVSNLGIVPGGSGATRNVVITPVANQTGTATITITVTDGGGKTASKSFTVTVTPPPAVKGDLDGDGQSDLLFEDNDGFLAAWFMSGTSLSSAGFLLPSNVGDSAYRVVATGDFDRDGNEDIVFQHTDGTLAIWFMSGTSQSSAALLNPSNPGDSRWRVVGAADINKDGKIDLVFQHTDGTLAVWYMDGTNLSSAALMSPSNPGDSRWHVVGVGDLNGDGNTDLVFQHTDGTLATWVMNGVTLSSASLLSPSNPGAGWHVAGTASISRSFAVSLTGGGERPTVTTAASGSGKLNIIGNQLSFSINYSGLSGAAIGAHIHLPSNAEGTAGVAINFQPFNGGAFGTSGSLIGSVTLTTDQLTAITTGQAYVNIHTPTNPGGEIRGQILPDASLAGKVDLLFQHDNSDLAIWFLDGTKLSSAQLLNPRSSGGTWKLVAPR